MSSEIDNYKLPIYKRIIFWVVMPVVIVGITISGVMIAYLSPPMESFLTENFSSHLRLASKLGIGICESHFSQLLDIRLEDNLEMNNALQKEALDQIKDIGKHGLKTHMLVLEDAQFVKMISIDFPPHVWKLPDSANTYDTVLDTVLGDERIKAHCRYFPFWDWHIISFVKEKDYLSPISTAHQIIYLSTMGVLAAVFITVLLVFYKSITRPLKQFITATKYVSEGKLLPIDPVPNNELGQLAVFFNGMVESLKKKTEEVNGLIQQLTESEERYRSLVELSPEAVIVHQDGIIKYINRSGAKILGATNQSELIDSTMMEFIHPAFYEAVSLGLKKAYNSHTTLPYQELKCIKIDKQIIDVEATGTYIEYLGKPAILSVVRNVSERKQSEAALRRSEEHLRSLFRAAPTGIGVVIDRVLKQVNKRLCEITGYSKEELIDQNARVLYPSEEDFEYVGREKYEQIRDHGTGTVETRWKRKDGHIIDVLLSSTPMDLDDLSKGVTFTALDITDRKQMEMALRKERDRAQRYLDVAGVMFIAIDAEQYVTMINRKGCEILGYEEHEIVGKSWFDHFLKAEHIEEIKEVFNQIMSGDIELFEYYENSVLIKSGEERNVAWHNSIIRDESGRIIGTLSSGEDITERKRVEEHLQQAQKMEAIGTLAGGVAHDFNNILSAIIGYSELSLSKLDPGTWVYGNLSKVVKAGERASDLVQQILTFSRQREREVLPVQIELVVKEVIKFIRATLPATIEIRQNIKDNPTVMADPTQVHQIIMNLCTNAGHSMEGKGGTLEIGLESLELDSKFMESHPELQPGKHVKLIVSDTGIGIPLDKLERIFDPYFTTKEKGKGTGLGLATVHGIVKSHGGAIVVESQVGKGTTFEVYLPLAIDNSEAKKDFETQLISGCERILLVDDEPDIIEVGKEILEQLGYTVTATDKADQALEIFANQPDQFDLVISDMTMPKITGDKLAGELIKIRSDIPILLCTGFSEKMSKKRAASLGIKGYLMKPVTLKTLSHGVRKVLDKKLS